MKVGKSIFKKVCAVAHRNVASSGNTKTYLYAALLSDLNLTRGTGTATFTRASASFTVDYAGQKQKMPAGAACFPGMRRVGDAWVATQIDGITPITGTKGPMLQPATVNKCTCWGVPRLDALGSEKLTTAQAACDSGWTFSFPSQENTTGGVLNLLAGTSVPSPYVTGSGILPGMAYTLTYTINSISGTNPGVRAQIYNGNTLTTRTSPGTYTETFICSYAGGVMIVASNNTTTAAIDNVSVKEAIDYVGTKAYHNGTVFQNPITGMTLSGDTAAVLSIVNDQTAIDSAIASEIAKGASAWDESLLVALELSRDNGYKSYDITTGAGGAGVVTYTGAMEAVATSMAETIRVLSGSCTLSDTSGTYTVTPTGTTYARAKKENFTPAAGATMKLTVAASSQVRCLAPQVESLPFATMTTPSEGASMSRAADILSYPLAGNMPLTGKRHIPMIYWTPRAVVAGRSEVIAKSFVDASNYVQVVSNGVIIYFEKRVAGVSEFVTFAITPVAGTTYAIDPWINADNTIGLKVNAVVAGTNTSTTVSPVFGTSMYVGSDGTNAINGQVMSLKITDGTTYPAGELEMPASLEMFNNLWMI